jgi:uncharacterized protein (DUF58 family)
VPLTRNGVIVAGAAIMLLAAGTAANYPELVLLGAACVAALLVAAAWMLARPNLSAKRSGDWPRRVTEGEQVTATLVVINGGRGPSPPVSITESINGEPFPVEVPSLAGRSEYAHEYELPTRRRGHFVIAEPEVGHSDPLRLMRIGKVSGESAELYVHPRTYPVAAIPTGGPRDAEGPTSSSSPQGGVAFHSLREYASGDDWRLIHWKSTARAGKPMVRHNVIPDEPRQLVVLDTRAGSYTGNRFEDAVRASASLVEAAGRAGLPLDLCTTGGTTASDGASVELWTSDYLPALDLLSEVDTRPDDPGLAALPDLVVDAVSSLEGVALAVVTGTPEPEELAVLTSIRPRFLTVSMIRFADRSMRRAAEPAGVITIDAHSSEEFAAMWNELVAR